LQKKSESQLENSHFISEEIPQTLSNETKEISDQILLTKKVEVIKIEPKASDINTSSTASKKGTKNNDVSIKAKVLNIDFDSLGNTNIIEDSKKPLEKIMPVVIEKPRKISDASKIPENMKKAKAISSTDFIQNEYFFIIIY